MFVVGEIWKIRLFLTVIWYKNLESAEVTNKKHEKPTLHSMIAKLWWFWIGFLYFFIKVTGDSLLIYEFAYSLFIGVCSVTSNMTCDSYAYHRIKLIHCGARQRDVLSDKMVFWMVTHSFYFMFCQSSLLSTVISFVYKDKWWFDESMSVTSVWKILEKELFYSLPTLTLYWIKLENFVMQLKRQSVEAWQNEKHYSKENNTSENPIPRQEISNQSTMWSTNVRSGHNSCCLCSFLVKLSSCRFTYGNFNESSFF